MALLTCFCANATGSASSLARAIRSTAPTRLFLPRPPRPPKWSTSPGRVRAPFLDLRKIPKVFKPHGLLFESRAHENTTSKNQSFSRQHLIHHCDHHRDRRICPDGLPHSASKPEYLD